MAAHRPYPPPATRAALRMTWETLLFMHWRVAAEALRPHIPAALAIDTFDGSAWIAVVPFRMRGTRPSFAPSIAPLSDFPELNVRTYVVQGGRPGVWFFSLDAASPLAVRIARRFFKLPYMDARMACQPEPAPRYADWGDGVRYASHRTHRGQPPADFAARYRPAGPAFCARPGSLDDFLTARYCFYAADRRGAVYRAEIDHPAWPLQPGEVEVECNTMTAPIGVTLPDEPPHLLFVRQLDVVGWLPVRVLSS
jgi:uncharacterized protein YqjF (DUF2071 family)